MTEQMTAINTEMKDLSNLSIGVESAESCVDAVGLLCRSFTAQINGAGATDEAMALLPSIRRIANLAIVTLVPFEPSVLAMKEALEVAYGSAGNNI